MARNVRPLPSAWREAVPWATFALLFICTGPLRAAGALRDVGVIGIPNWLEATVMELALFDQRAMDALLLIAVALGLSLRAPLVARLAFGAAVLIPVAIRLAPDALGDAPRIVALSGLIALVPYAHAFAPSRKICGNKAARLAMLCCGPLWLIDPVPLAIPALFAVALLARASAELEFDRRALLRLGLASSIAALLIQVLPKEGRGALAIWARGAPVPTEAEPYLAVAAAMMVAPFALLMARGPRAACAALALFAMADATTPLAGVLFALALLLETSKAPGRR